MNQFPGYTLEAFLQWHYDLSPNADGNLTLQLIPPNLSIVDPYLTPEQFMHIVSTHESLRTTIETNLDQYDLRRISWSQYCLYMEELVPIDLDFHTYAFIKEHVHRNQKETLAI